MGANPAIPKGNWVALLSWAFYDFANSAFAVVVETFIFASYFVKSVSSDPTQGTASWGLTVGLVGIIIAFLGPLIGAIADQSGHRKRWIAAFTALAVVSSSLLWFVKPLPDHASLGLFLVSLGMIGSEMACTFYNAMLPSLSDQSMIGRWSGWGWAFGYVGGLLSLSLALFLFIYAEPPFFSFLNRDEEEHIRAIFLLVGLWYTLFSLPLFLFTPKSKGKDKPLWQAFQDSLKQLGSTLSLYRSYPHIFRFLLAKMFYSDALITLFTFGGIFAASTFQFTEEEILIFAITMNLSAGIGAAVLACFDDIFGGRKVIVASLLALVVLSTWLLFAKTQTEFWVLGLSLGLFVGPVQASSRSYLARVTPRELRNQIFGFNTLSGKATSFIGPFLVGWITYESETQEAGLIVIVALLLLGLMGMWTIPDDNTALLDDLPLGAQVTNDLPNP